MSNFITDIPSDSTIVRIEFKDNLATITFKLSIYEDDKDTKILHFADVVASNLLPGWQSDIEGIEVKNESDLLEKIKHVLKADEENMPLLKSYQAISSSRGTPVIEIIARAYKVEKI